MEVGHDYGDETLSEAWAQTTRVEKFRVAIGLVARGAFWLCLWFIVGNAAVQAIHEHAWVLMVVELGAFPATALIYPFAAHADALAWPLAAGTSFIPFMVAMIVAYPVSTIIGGMPPVGED